MVGKYYCYVPSELIVENYICHVTNTRGKYLRSFVVCS